MTPLEIIITIILSPIALVAIFICIAMILAVLVLIPCALVGIVRGIKQAMRDK